MTARPAALDDLPSIDALYRRSEIALGVLPEGRTDYLRWRWQQPYVDVSRDTRVCHRDGEMVGFAGTHREEGVGPLFAMGRVDPAEVGRGLGSWILHWFDAAAAGRGAGTIRTGCPVEDGDGQRLFRAHGYARVRSAFDMGVDLTGNEQAPEPPAGVTLRRFRPGEERTLWRVATESFRDHWDHEQDQAFETFLAEWFTDEEDASRIVLAETEGQVVGELSWIGTQEGAYVGSVGVLPGFRRRGIAGALLGTALSEAAAQGFRHLSLSVDGQSPTGAVGVYERAGLTVARTVEVFIKELS